MFGEHDSCKSVAQRAHKRKKLFKNQPLTKMLLQSWCLLRMVEHSQHFPHRTFLILLVINAKMALVMWTFICEFAYSYWENRLKVLILWSKVYFFSANLVIEAQKDRAYLPWITRETCTKFGEREASLGDSISLNLLAFHQTTLLHNFIFNCS